MDNTEELKDILKLVTKIKTNHPRDLSFRANGYFTSFSAAMVKLIADRLDKLSDKDIERLIAVPTQVTGGMDTYGNYIKKINALRLERVAKTKGKEAVKNASEGSTGISLVVESVWSQIVEDVEKHAKDAAVYVRDRVIDRQNRLRMYQSMSPEEMTTKFGSPRGFYRSDEYRSLSKYESLNPDNEAEKAEKKYIKSEKDKITTLLLRVQDKVGSISDPKVQWHSSTDLTLSVAIQSGERLDVQLFLIGAGGYNIQVFHYRWLARFYLNGKKYEISTKD